MNPRAVLSHPLCYFYMRQIMSLGLPFRQWVTLYGLSGPRERIADIGCGPADILRYVKKESRPEFYLGLDMSQRYLDAAAQRTSRIGLDAKFLAMDLERLPTDEALRREVVDLLEEHRITRVLLLGVVHHIDDESALHTLNLIHSASTVQTLVTQDVVYQPGRWLNNRFCDWDRGEHVRDEAGYDALARRTDWPRFTTSWTSPGLRSIRYNHYHYHKT
jgi:SAM-dependent methyltransferase